MFLIELKLQLSLFEIISLLLFLICLIKSVFITKGYIYVTNSYVVGRQNIGDTMASVRKREGNFLNHGHSCRL